MNKIQYQGWFTRPLGFLCITDLIYYKREQFLCCVISAIFWLDLIATILIWIFCNSKTKLNYCQIFAVVLFSRMTFNRKNKTMANISRYTEEFEDTKGVIRIRVSKKNRQHNGQNKKVQTEKQRSTKHTHKTTRTPLKTWGKLISCSISSTRHSAKTQH